MNVVCVGGGPAGLCFAIAMKRLDPESGVTLFERNPPELATGWGVTLGTDLLDELRAIDAPSAQMIADAAYEWVGQMVAVEGRGAVMAQGGGLGVGRRELISGLLDRAVELGVDVRREHADDAAIAAVGADVVVAADGVHSPLRTVREGAFGTESELGANRFVWLGTRKVFDSFLFGFVPTPAGWIWCYAYGYDEETSTIIIECSSATWEGLGLGRMSTTDTVAYLEGLFAEYLDGEPILTQGVEDPDEPMRWLTFRHIANERWGAGNVALLGDAAHATHYSIGSGTRLAFQDAIALANALTTIADVPAALAQYTAVRREATAKPMGEARLSAGWFEQLPRYIDLDIADFTHVLMSRYSVLLPRISPRRYVQLHRATEEVTVLRELRAWAVPRARALRRRASGV